MNATPPPSSDESDDDESAEGGTPFDLSYTSVSGVSLSATGAQVAISGETHRKPVSFTGKLRDPLQFREVLSTLYAIVSADYRYKPKDKTAYAAYLRMKRETSNLGVWQAQQAYFSWLHRNDPLAAFILDPIITVHPDRILFEVFSRDECRLFVPRPRPGRLSRSVIRSCTAPPTSISPRRFSTASSRCAATGRRCWRLAAAA